MDRLLEYVSHHPFLISLAVAMVLAVLVFEVRDRGRNFASIPPQDAIRLMNQGAQVVDLRDSAAFTAGHVNGARHLAPEQRGSAADSLKKFKDKMLVLYCEEGQTAASVTRQLHANGFSKVFTLRGGLAAWRAEGLPLKRG